MSELYLTLEVVGTNKIWNKYFKTAIEMDLFIKKIKNSKRIAVIDDSRNYYFEYYERSDENE